MFSNVKNSTPDLEDIFRDLAASISNDIVHIEEDEYEEDVEELDKLLLNNTEDASDDEFEEEEPSEMNTMIAQQHLDIDVSFDDEEIED